MLLLPPGQSKPQPQKDRAVRIEATGARVTSSTVVAVLQEYVQSTVAASANAAAKGLLGGERGLSGTEVSCSPKAASGFVFILVCVRCLLGC